LTTTFLSRHLTSFAIYNTYHGTNALLKLSPIMSSKVKRISADAT
jgi:hypothetical protein